MFLFCQSCHLKQVNANVTGFPFRKQRLLRMPTAAYVYVGIYLFITTVKESDNEEFDLVRSRFKGKQFVMARVNRSEPKKPVLRHRVKYGTRDSKNPILKKNETVSD